MPSSSSDISGESTPYLLREHRRLLDLADQALNTAAQIEAELHRRLPPDDPELLKLMKKGGRS